jgi:hypothetical protein
MLSKNKYFLFLKRNFNYIKQEKYIYELERFIQKLNIYKKIKKILLKNKKNQRDIILYIN